MLRNRNTKAMQKKTREEIIAEVKRYLRENIEDFDERVSEAWDKIDMYRAPLYLIDSNLSDKILETAREWFEEEFQDAEEFI